MFRKMGDGVAKLVVVVHVDEILVGVANEACDELNFVLNETFPTNNLGVVQWYMGCVLKRNWHKRRSR